MVIQWVHVTQSLCDLMDCSGQASVFMGFSRQEYWSGLPFPPSGNLPDWTRVSCVFCIAGRFSTVWATRETQITCSLFSPLYIYSLVSRVTSFLTLYISHHALHTVGMQHSCLTQNQLNKFLPLPQEWLSPAPEVLREIPRPDYLALQDLIKRRLENHQI